MKISNIEQVKDGAVTVYDPRFPVPLFAFTEWRGQIGRTETLIKVDTIYRQY